MSYSEHSMYEEGAKANTLKRTTSPSLPVYWRWIYASVSHCSNFYCEFIREECASVATSNQQPAYVCRLMLFGLCVYVWSCLKHAIFTIRKSVRLWIKYRNRRLFRFIEWKICHTLRVERKSNHKHFHSKCFRQLPFCFFSFWGEHKTQKKGQPHCCRYTHTHTNSGSMRLYGDIENCWNW